MSESKIVNTMSSLDKSVNTLSGAIHITMENLQSSIDKLVNSFEKFSTELNKSSEKTEKLTKALVFWTKIMALAVLGQIGAIIWTNLKN